MLPALTEAAFVYIKDGGETNLPRLQPGNRIYSSAACESVSMAFRLSTGRASAAPPDT